MRTMLQIYYFRLIKNSKLEKLIVKVFNNTCEHYI